MMVVLKTGEHLHVGYPNRIMVNGTKLNFIQTIDRGYCNDDEEHVREIDISQVESINS
jgi:hypothetical protein